MALAPSHSNNACLKLFVPSPRVFFPIWRWMPLPNNIHNDCSLPSCWIVHSQNIKAIKITFYLAQRMWRIVNQILQEEYRQECLDIGDCLSSPALDSLVGMVSSENVPMKYYTSKDHWLLGLVKVGDMRGGRCCLSSLTSYNEGR